jgi:hypothetical protein
MSASIDHAILKMELAIDTIANNWTVSQFTNDLAMVGWPRMAVWFFGMEGGIY